VKEKEAASLIIEIPGARDSVFYAARNQIVAEKDIDYVAGGGRRLADLLITLVSSVKESPIEMDVLRTIVRSYIGSRGQDSRLFTDDRRRILDAIRDSGARDSVVLHHCGLFAMSSGDLRTAEALLEESLRVINDRYVDYFLKTESPRNIYNSLGQVFARMAEAAEGTHDAENAEALYEKASAMFNRAMEGKFQGNQHAYHGYCKMWFKRAQRSGPTIPSLTYLANALESMDRASDEVADEDRLWLDGLAVEVRRFLGAAPTYREL
jgi:hypothetical protein